MSVSPDSQNERQLPFTPEVLRTNQAREDAAQVKRALAGEPEAFDCLVQRYQPVLYNVALRVTGNPDDAQDIAQMAFLRAWTNLHKFDPGRRFFSWLYRIALNLSLTTKSRRAEITEVPENLASIAASPLEEIEMRQRRQSMNKAIASLPLHYREVVLLRHMGELSYQEIADALGLPEKTVKSRLFTARRQLAEQVSRSEGHMT